MKFKVIGLKFGQGMSELATFNTEELAEQHKKTTFKDLGYDKLFVKPVQNNSTFEVLVPDVIASDNDSYLYYQAKLEMLDWEKLIVDQTKGTLLDFYLNPEKYSFTNANQIKKILNLGIDSLDEDGNVESVSLKYISKESEPFPHTTIVKKLQKELEKTLVESYSSSVEDVFEPEEPEEPSSKTPTKDELEKEKQAKLEAEKAEQEKQAKLKAEKDEKEAQAKLEAEKAEKEAQAKLEAEKAEQEKQAKLKAEKAEQEKQAKLKAEKAEKEKQAKLEAEKAEQEKQAKLKAEKAEQEKQAKLEAEKAEQEKQAPQDTGLDLGEFDLSASPKDKKESNQSVFDFKSFDLDL